MTGYELGKLIKQSGLGSMLNGVANKHPVAAMGLAGAGLGALGGNLLNRMPLPYEDPEQRKKNRLATTIAGALAGGIGGAGLEGTLQATLGPILQQQKLKQLAASMPSGAVQ